MDPLIEIEQHILTIASRSDADGQRLAARMVRDCWPGGSVDRTVPAALEWVRRWAPVRVGAGLPACSCRSGRCAVCN